MPSQLIDSPRPAEGRDYGEMSSPKQQLLSSPTIDKKLQQQPSFPNLRGHKGFTAKD